LQVLGSSSDDILKKYGITPVPEDSSSGNGSSSSSSKPVPIKQQSSGVRHAWACMHAYNCSTAA
jgi:hypothetical protein